MKSNSQTEENYLKALYNLANDKAEINATDLAKSLEVSLPTVNSMVKRLSEREYLSYEKYKPLRLTKKGSKAAADIIRKHRLTEMYLVEKMGFGWEEVHMIAEQVEHIKSERFFDRMDELLGFPRFDPHGSPIPDKNGEVISQELLELAKVEIGKTYELKALSNSSQDLLNYLNTKSLTIGSKIELKSKESFDDSLVVSYGNHSSEVLSQKVSQRLMVILSTEA